MIYTFFVYNLDESLYYFNVTRYHKTKKVRRSPPHLQTNLYGKI